MSKLQRDTFLLNQLPSVSVGKDKHKHVMEVFCLWNKIYVYLRNTPQNMRSFLETLFERFKSLLQFLGYPVSFITNLNEHNILCIKSTNKILTKQIQQYNHCEWKYCSVGREKCIPRS